MASTTYSNESHIFVWNGSTYQKLKLNNILWIEKKADKIRIVAQDHHYWLNTDLERIHRLIPYSALKRVHPSFIVNMNRIEGFDHHHILIRQKSIPIGTDFRDFFKTHFEVSPNLIILAKEQLDEATKSLIPPVS